MIDFALQNPICQILAARGYWKTEIMAKLRMMHRIIYKPDRTIAYIMRREDKAQRIVDDTGSRFRQDVIIENYGNLCGKPWGGGSLRLKNHKIHGSEPNIMAFSVRSSNLTGQHYNDFVLDDCFDYESSISKAEDEHTEGWISNTVFGAKRPSFSLLAIGTRYLPGDYYERKIKNGVPTLVIPAIYEKGKEHPLAQYPNVVLPDRRFESLWEEWVPRHEDKKMLDGSIIPCLETLRSEMGETAFEAQYNQNVEGFEGQIIRDEWIEYVKDSDINWEKGIRIVGVDPAIARDTSSQRDKQSYFAITAIIFDPVRMFYDVVWHRHDRLTYIEEKKLCRDLCIKFGAHHMMIEYNTFQYALYEEMYHDEDLIRERNANIKVHGKDSRSKKAEYLRQQQGKFQNHRVRFLRDPKNKDTQKMMDRLVSNITTFMYQTYQDPTDSLVRALECADIVNTSRGGWFV